MICIMIIIIYAWLSFLDHQGLVTAGDESQVGLGVQSGKDDSSGE